MAAGIGYLYLPYSDHGVKAIVANSSRPANPLTGASIGALTAASEKRSQAARVQHRHEVRQRLILPLAIVGGVMVVLLIALVLLFSGHQIGIIASFAVVILVVPLIIIGLIPYALLLVAVAGMGRVYRMTDKGLAHGQRLSRAVHMQTTNVSKAVTRPFIIAQKRLAWLDRVGRSNPLTGRDQR